MLRSSPKPQPPPPVTAHETMKLAETPEVEKLEVPLQPEKKIPAINIPVAGGAVDPSVDPIQRSFYDDPKLSYTIDKPMTNWDEKRRAWLQNHPSFSDKSDRVLLITGTQPTPCRHPTGDHLLLRFFKNKVDYCRIHGYDIFYNNAFMHPKMRSYWAKIAVIRAAMLSHPEAEWIYWVDSDAVFTDMDFKLPLNKYKNHNMVVDGWPSLIFEKRSWIGLNAGVILIRNCQWSMEFLDAWASMGPQTPNYEKWGRILQATLSDKTYPESDDQSAIVYLLLKEKHKWADKIYIENEYSFQGYWAFLVDKYENITKNYDRVEKQVRRLRRRHAEKVTLSYAGYGKESGKRPFITHFTGCQPCSGDHNKIYAGDACYKGMVRALNFADNQVLRNFGLVHKDLLDSASLLPLPYDFPS
ncbi:Xyloglucan 6-xylosyltransferase [Bertholletia excelsa]